jgi:hypothetical protein
VEASCWWDIERAVPSKEYPDLCRHYCDALIERTAARAAIIEPLVGDEDEATGEVAGPEFKALQEFAETTPTTLKGLLAMVAYAGEINAKNADAFDRDTPISRIWRPPPVPSLEGSHERVRKISRPLQNTPSGTARFARRVHRVQHRARIRTSKSTKPAQTKTPKGRDRGRRGQQGAISAFCR